MNFCTDCGGDISGLTGPRFCPHCGKALAALTASEKPAKKEAWSPWDEVLKEQVPPVIAVGRFLTRSRQTGTPTAVGVILRASQTIEASLPLHDEALVKALDGAMPGTTLPGNCMADPNNSRELWRDSKGRLVSRAAAIAYYVYGVGYSRLWHLVTPLQANNAAALVTVDEDRLDFRLAFADDMDGAKYATKLRESMEMLDRYLHDGIKTKNVEIPPVGKIVSSVLFGLDGQ